MTGLRRRSASDIHGSCSQQTCEVSERAEAIVREIRDGGDKLLRTWCANFRELRDGRLLLKGDALAAALDRLDDETRRLLERTARRIRVFAEAQRSSLNNVTIPIPGGRAGHEVTPIENVGCYAPGGRYPLPSSVLMTVIPARVAGCARVCLATPAPSDLMLAAAAIAGADEVLCAGGAHAIGAMAYGTETVDPVDLIVGPGNAWVTAAKRSVIGQVGIDALAGPSELLVIADEQADPELIAADLLAQAEHDTEAIPMLLTAWDSVANAVNGAIESQLQHLCTAPVARAAIQNGFCVVCEDEEEVIRLSDRLAAEHVQVITGNAKELAQKLTHYGALFIGARSAEVLGDYGAGPNHVLPTARTSRFSGGLSVLSYLRVRTWIAIDDSVAAEALNRDASRLARLEGLEAHARAAECRLSQRQAAHYARPDVTEQTGGVDQRCGPR
ncbi:MAG: histidinol dehydrogenase [Polyangiaceae bacterium]